MPPWHMLWDYGNWDALNGEFVILWGSINHEPTVLRLQTVALIMRKEIFTNNGVTFNQFIIFSLQAKILMFVEVYII